MKHGDCALKIGDGPTLTLSWPMPKLDQSRSKGYTKICLATVATMNGTKAVSAQANLRDLLQAVGGVGAEKERLSRLS